MTLAKHYKPLYQQVYEILVGRIADSYWKPSQALPSEFELANELGVSQGTVRKALNLMVSEKLLQRRQGKGTYVAEHTQESSLQRFFRFTEPHGNALTPDTRVISVKRRKIKLAEKKALDLRANSQVVEMVRVRSLKNKACILETIIQPLSVFPNIDKIPELPNFLYELYQDKFKVSITEVREKIRAVTLSSKEAKILSLPKNTPALSIERTSFSLDGRKVEWSTAICSTEHFVYAVHLK